MRGDDLFLSYLNTRILSSSMQVLKVVSWRFYDDFWAVLGLEGSSYSGKFSSGVAGSCSKGIAAFVIILAGQV